MNHTAEISGKTFRVTCSDALAPQGKWLLNLLASIEAERGTGFLDDGVRVGVGWSILTIRKQGDVYDVCQPNYAGDPFHQTSEDLTLTLSIQAQQNLLLARLGVQGVPVSFQDKVVLARGILSAKRIYLERKPPTPGDSGWYIGPADNAPQPSEYEALLVYQLLHQRVSVLKVLALPVGYLVVFDGDEIEAILNDQDQQLTLK
jgi:hypothetical protein